MIAERELFLLNWVGLLLVLDVTSCLTLLGKFLVSSILFFRGVDVAKGRKFNLGLFVALGILGGE